MPSRAPRLLSSHIYQAIAFPRFTCPSCVLHRAIARQKFRQYVAQLQNQRRRYASTFASPATVNKAIDVPPASRELYDALEILKEDASGFTNLSRVQLAIRSLESGGRSSIRVAVLGFKDSASARQLVRLLLADPLGKEGAWERNIRLGKGKEDDGRNVLLR
jgi:hypothetical protein